MSLLCDLPDEILLEIIRYLEAIRSFENQSEAFKAAKKEKERQRENYLRQQTLYALCLTSRRLRCLSLPTLYSSSISCALPDGLRQLQLLHRTIDDANNALGRTGPLLAHLRYIENRLADFRGNSLGDIEGEQFQDTQLADYFERLATLVLRTPNLEHVCVVSVEYEDVSYWDHVLNSSLTSLQGGPIRLKHLFAQIHAYQSVAGPGLSLVERILKHVRSLPVLSDLRLSGANASRDHDLASDLNEIANVRRLELTECNLEMIDVANLLMCCTNLKHFVCKWQNVVQSQIGPSVLQTALISRAHTLETLVLDWRAVRHRPFIETESAMIGSLAPLNKLRSLEICALGFSHDRCPLWEIPREDSDITISEILPNSLEYLGLLFEDEYDSLENDVLEDIWGLWAFSTVCGTSLPRLETLRIKAGRRRPIFSPNLTDAFAKAGVRLLSEEEFHR